MDPLQHEIDKLNCKEAYKALASLGFQGSKQYYDIHNFIKHVERLQTKVGVLLLSNKDTK